MVTEVTDAQIEQLLGLMEQVEKGVKWGRIPFDEAIDLVSGLNDKYPVASVISIDRSQPFDPVKGWTTIAEEDRRSLALAEMDLTKVRFESMLLKRIFRAGETSTGRIRLDAKVFQTLWENQTLIPESWKERINGKIRYIYFAGTELQSPIGLCYVLFLYWGAGRWCWNFGYWCAGDPSAVIASI